MKVLLLLLAGLVVVQARTSFRGSAAPPTYSDCTFCLEAFHGGGGIQDLCPILVRDANTAIEGYAAVVNMTQQYACSANSSTKLKACGAVASPDDADTLLSTWQSDYIGALYMQADLQFQVHDLCGGPDPYEFDDVITASYTCKDGATGYAPMGMPMMSCFSPPDMPTPPSDPASKPPPRPQKAPRRPRKPKAPKPPRKPRKSRPPKGRKLPPQAAGST